MTVFGSGDQPPARKEQRGPASQPRLVAAEPVLALFGPTPRKRRFYISVSAPKFNEKPQ
jgi:hypothetical protein